MQKPPADQTKEARVRDEPIPNFPPGEGIGPAENKGANGGGWEIKQHARRKNTSPEGAQQNDTEKTGVLP